MVNAHKHRIQLPLRDSRRTVDVLFAEYVTDYWTLLVKAELLSFFFFFSNIFFQNVNPKLSLRGVKTDHLIYLQFIQ